MERLLMSDLVAWKDSRRRKPLILNGARQVGKTWLLKEFGRQCFKNVVYVNFDSNPRMVAQFETDYDVNRILDALRIETHEPIAAGETLVILDEIQECPRALTSLKYFCEDAREYHVVAAGSLLGVSFHEGTGYPVGKVNTLDLYPMSFREFLDAVGEGMLRKLVDAGDFGAIGPFSDKLERLLKTYYYVGGMPEAVDAYVESGDLEEARAVQRDILFGYERDVSKHLSVRETEFTLAAWKSIPSHLSRENKKFVFGHIRDGARARDYRAAITWLDQAGIATRVSRVSKPGVPLSAYADEGAFKLFLVDVGLLGAMAGLDAHSVLNGNEVYEEFKGSLTEQYVCQQLVASGLVPYYWSAENSAGEIDFLVQKDAGIYPIEVKAEENVRARSLRVFNEANRGMSCRRFSLSGYRDEEWMVNVPLFAIGNPSSWA